MPTRPMPPTFLLKLLIEKPDVTRAREPAGQP
ncbi:hypothetical protein J2T17_001114 [Paenibacillus mucilaginosus]